MHGAIDEVHIFDKALSDSEIRLLAAGASTEDIDRVLQPVSRKYPYGYQGQFAEKDEETGWNHFELREYDAVIGRWTTIDAAKQYWSPYLGIGNDPVNGVDPDGAFKTKLGAQLYAFLHGGEVVHNENDNEYLVNMLDDSYSMSVAADWVSQGFSDKAQDFASDVWNHPLTRVQIPDFITLGAGFNGIAILGGGSSIEMNWVLRGPEASWKPVITVTQAIGAGYSIDATLNVGGANYLGDVNDIRRGMLETSIGQGDVTYWGSAGIAAGGKIGVTGTYTPTQTGYGIIGRYLNVGAGLPAGPVPVNASGGVSNTFIIKDFHD